MHKLWILVCLVFLACGPQWQPDPGPTEPEKQQATGSEIDMSTTYAGSDVFPSAVTIPSDGDTKPATSVNVALEGLADRTQYLLERQNDFWTYAFHDDEPTQVEVFEYDTIGTAWTKSMSIKVDVPSMSPDDELRAKLYIGSFNMSGMGTSNGLVRFRLYSIDDVGGAAVQQVVLDSAGMVQANGSAGGNDLFFPLSVAGKHVIVNAGTCRIGLEIRLSLALAGFQAEVYSGIHLEVQKIKAP